MGKRAKWIGAVKKVFRPESSHRKPRRSRDRLGCGNPQLSDSSNSESFEAEASSAAAAEAPPATPPPAEAAKPADAEREQRKQASDGIAADEAVHRIRLSELSGDAREEAAAIMIQTAFRGYMARRALHALRGLGRLKSLIHGDSVKRQATTTLRCMQTLVRVQSQIQTRRVRMSEENQALQRQLLLERERELESLKMGDGWDDSLQSKEKIEASLLRKQEAATRRERSLAYAHSHQWKNTTKSGLFMDPRNPHWGWSWLERWMAARPLDGRSTTDRELSNDHASVKNTGGIVGCEITGAYACRDTNSDSPSPAAQKPVRPPSRQSPTTPLTKAPSLVGRVVKSASPRSSWPQPEDDSRSTVGIQSARYRRHSVAGGSSLKDDESLTSLPSLRNVPSYMVPTESARAKTTPDKEPVGSVKKRLSFPVGEKHVVISPAEVRRHSGPPKVDIAVAV